MAIFAEIYRGGGPLRGWCEDHEHASWHDLRQCKDTASSAAHFSTPQMVVPGLERMASDDGGLTWRQATEDEIAACQPSGTGWTCDGLHCDEMRRAVDREAGILRDEGGERSARSRRPRRPLLRFIPKRDTR